MTIQEELNILESLDDDFEGTFIIDGEEGTVYGDAGDGYCQTELEETAYFKKSGNSYERKGYKVILYDRWDGTNWGGWDIAS